jgi:UDP-glucose 4-epimerase
MMLRGEAPTIHGAGEQSRDFTYIQNVVEANLLAAAAPSQKVAGHVFNVATAQAITLNDTVSVLRKITAYRGPVNHGPERQGDVRHSLADISAAEHAIGYHPSVSFEEGLRRTVEWYASALSVRS